MDPLLLGAVAYDAKVVTIWDGFRNQLRESGFNLDFVLYSHYERQVEALLDGGIDIAWNSPLAWVRSRRLAAARGVSVRAIVMRDTDQDLRSVVVVRHDSGITTPEDLRGRVLGVGAVDSPQATLLPLSTIRTAGIDPDREIDVRYFNVGVGLHGDHIGGEREAAIALTAGTVDAICVSDTNLLAFGREGTLPTGSVRVIGQSAAYDHCNLTAGPSADLDATDRFTELLLGMSYADPRLRSLFDLEGLKQWLPGRTELYAPLETAVDQAGFYGTDGEVIATNYRP